MEAVRSLLNGLGCTTHLIDIDALGLELKGDAVDWLENNHSEAIAKDAPMELRARAKDAVMALACVVDAELSNSVAQEIRATETDTGSDVVAEGEAKTESTDEVITRLSKLRQIDYDKVRKEEAGKLGVRPASLDAEVRMKQKEKDNASDAPFKDVEPWHSPVNGDELLQAVTNTIHKYVICNKHTAISAALWVAHTYLIDVIHCSPLAIITAPDKGCGKSTLLDVMADMVYQPVPTASISAAALYRTIEKYHPTLLIDEVDSFLAGDEAMRGIINCGHKRKAAYVMRCEGDNNEPKRFSTWSAKLLSGISAKNLHPTITSRAIMLELRKKLPTETIASNRNNQAEYHAISRKLVRWSTDIKAQVAKSTTALPNGLDDRQKDNWEPLLAIADIAGGRWSELARETAIAMSSQEENKSYKTELLEDIKSVFESRKIDRISTHDLIADLCADDEGNWATYNRGKEINPKQLATLLRGYGIISNTLRFGNQSPAKGFERVQFLDVWARYVDISLSPFPVLTPLPLQTNGYMAPSVTAENPPPVTRYNECNGVTGVTGGENLPVTLEANKYMVCNGRAPKTGEGPQVFLSGSEAPSKSELDTSWDQFINELEPEKVAVRTGF
jgi:putative DNA primase/helicase